MVEYSKIKGKIGIFPEGTTLKENNKDFNEFNNSFIRLATSTKAIVQPITIYWINHWKIKKPVVNFGEAIEVSKDNSDEMFDAFLKTQNILLNENKKIADYIDNYMR